MTVLCLQMDRKITDPATIQFRAPIGPPFTRQAGTYLNRLTCGPGRDKTCLRGFQHIETQTSLLSYRDYKKSNYKIAISLEASLDMILCNTLITKALIRLRRLVSAFVVRKPLKTGFLLQLSSSTNEYVCTYSHAIA